MILNQVRVKQQRPDCRQHMDLFTQHDAVCFERPETRKKSAAWIGDNVRTSTSEKFELIFKLSSFGLCTILSVDWIFLRRIRGLNWPVMLPRLWHSIFALMYALQFFFFIMWTNEYFLLRYKWQFRRNWSFQLSIATFIWKNTLKKVRKSPNFK